MTAGGRAAELSVATEVHGRILIEVPPAPGPHPWLVGFHGYGENAEAHLEELRSIPVRQPWILASVAALHPFYTKSGEVVASWMTRLDRERAIADNVGYVDRALEAVERAAGPPARLVFAGFSQGVAMAYRAAAYGARPAAGVIALAGDVPPELVEASALRLPSVLIGRGQEDAWYTEERLAADLAVLERRGVAAASCVFAGGHVWTDAFRKAAAAFLDARSQ